MGGPPPPPGDGRCRGSPGPEAGRVEEEEERGEGRVEVMLEKNEEEEEEKEAMKKEVEEQEARGASKCWVGGGVVPVPPHHPHPEEGPETDSHDEGWGGSFYHSIVASHYTTVELKWMELTICLSLHSYFPSMKSLPVLHIHLFIHNRMRTSLCISSWCV